MADSILKVYSAKPILPDVSRVLACLYEKDVKFELKNLYPGHHIARDLLTLQASTRSPVTAWEDGQTLLFESRALCRYISEKYADRGNRYLLGKDILERASIEQWLKLEEQSFDPLSRDLTFHLAFAVEPCDRALLVSGAQKLTSVLDAYDQRLGDYEFLAGDEFSLADLSHLPNSHYIAHSDEWGHLFESRKNVRRWWHAISRRPSWEKVVETLNEVDIERGDQEEDATASKETQKEKSSLHILPSKSSGTQPLTSFVPQPKTHKVELFKGSSTSTSELPRQDPTKPQSSEGSKLGEDDGPTSSKSSGATSTQSTPSTDMSAKPTQASSTSTSEVPREDFVKPSSSLTPTASQASLAATDVSYSMSL
ncbi:glutathione S-transferase F11-like [Zingiber officinale]|uniref:glutathione S-transferase F11-like n=1 Tax=Zingiber officinale TaxID=94328 RepID=UPI001C4B8039|nr:glutathione S-transferase F11-like [Zingiber officinale]